MPLHWRAWQVVTEKHGLNFPEDRFYSLGGVPSRDILKLLAEEQGRSLDHVAIAHEKEETYLPLIAQAEPIHAVVEIAKANQGKIPMAVASGGTQKIIGLRVDLADETGGLDWPQIGALGYHCLLYTSRTRSGPCRCSGSCFRAGAETRPWPGYRSAWQTRPAQNRSDRASASYRPRRPCGAGPG